MPQPPEAPPPGSPPRTPATSPPREAASGAPLGWIRLTADQTQPLRQSVLRPHQRLGEIEFAGDRAPDTLHVGALDAGELVSIATLCREPEPGGSDPDSWRLRGMATAPAARGRGHGRTLVRVCLDHAARHGAHSVWCNARVPARGFYEALGFRVLGAPFDLAQIGPHVRMVRGLP